MKRYIRTEKQNIVELNVTIDIGYHTDSVAASDYIEHPKNIRKTQRIDNIKLVILNDIVWSLMSVMNSHGFKIIKRYQSKKSYAYYIWCDIDPEKKFGLPIFKINFRIADHLNKGLDDDIVEASNVYIKSIYIGENEYKDPMKMMRDFDAMCDKLQQGDLSGLFDSSSEYNKRQTSSTAS